MASLLDMAPEVLDLILSWAGCGSLKEQKSVRYNLVRVCKALEEAVNANRILGRRLVGKEYPRVITEDPATLSLYHKIDWDRGAEFSRIFVALLRHKHGEEVEAALDRYPLIDLSINDNEIIWLASERGHLSVVIRSLEDPRVDPSVREKSPQRAMFRQNNLYQEREGATSSSVNDNWAIRVASYNGHLEVVNRLLEDPRVDPSAHCNEAIRAASKRGHLGVVSRLLEDPRVDPLAQNYEAIQIASYGGHLGVVSRLLEDRRVNPIVSCSRGIVDAACNGHHGVVKRLLEGIKQRASLEVRTAVIVASRNGHLEAVNHLLEHPWAIPPAEGNEAIRWASEHGHLSVVNRLLEDGRVAGSLSAYDLAKYRAQIASS